MRILIFSQYYPPEIGATQNRMHFFATQLGAIGHDVTVVTEVPNHPSGIIGPEYRRVGWKRSFEDGIRVIRVWVKTAPAKTFWVRIAFYLTYALNATIASLLLTGHRFDIVLVTSPPLTVGIPAYLYSRIRRAPMVLDVRDLWPVLAVELGEMRNARVVAAARRLELLLYRHAARITVVTKAFARYVAEQGLPERKIVFLPNGTTAKLFYPTAPEPVLKRQLGLEGRFVVAFLGNHGIAQDLDRVLDAANLLREDDRVRFLFVGEGPVKAALIEEKERLNLTNVIFCPQVPTDKVLAYIALADAVLVPLRKIELFKGFVPSKLFDFMACARPIILQVDGEAREILEEAGAGVFVPPGDSQGLADAISHLATMPGTELEALGCAGLAFVRQHFMREQQVERLDALLNELMRSDTFAGEEGTCLN